MLLFLFIRSAGIVQSRFSKSISSHRAPAALLGLTMVCNCHSIKQRVVRFMCTFKIVCINLDNWSGLSVGGCCLAGAWKALLIPAKGL